MSFFENKLDFVGLVNSLPIGVLRWDPKGRQVVFANDKIREMLGYDGAIEIGKLSVSQIFADPKVFASLVREAVRDGQVMRREMGLRTRAGGLIPGLVSLSAVKAGSGKGVLIDAVIEEVVGSNRAEQEMRESRELFRRVFDNSAAAIIVASQDQRIIAWNPFAEKMLGRDKFDLFNKPIGDLYPSGEWERLMAQRVKSRGLVTDLETQITHREGFILDVKVSLSFIRNPSGDIVSSIVIMQDITRQKMAERRIKESENKIRIILDNSAAAITLTDDQERLISWNLYTEQLLGYSKSELYLKPVSTLYPPEEWQRIREAEIRKMGSKHHFETKAIHQDGRQIDVDLSVNILKDSDDKIIGSVGIMQDITEQKKVQQMLVKAKIAAEEASSAKSLFLANMSHEVRTPMNTIIGMIDLTLDTELNAEQRENLNTVKNAADILLSLLNDILDLSRVEAGKIQLEKVEMNVRIIVQSVCKGLSVLARNKNLQLAWDIPDDVPETLVGDPVRVRQVLVNLINNSIKFTFKGSITTHIKRVSAQDGVCELQFAVSDEGIGIPKEKQETIFEHFTQADISTTRRFGGSGLGLSISKKLVEMMGGKIWVESEEFKGSTFFFTAKFDLPVKAEPAAAPVAEIPAPVPGAAVPKEIGPISILLAEDNLVNQKITAKLLEKRGWRVKVANNGKQVLEILDQETFDVILMDAQMPVMDGFESTQMIRDREKTAGGHVPIIALTARAMAGDRKRCLDAGMDGYVTKPIDRQKLYETIEGFF